jgi:putative hydrolase of the HAD superfamily
MVPTSQQTLREGLLAPGTGRGLIVFDADDTLWSTEPLYDAARRACRSIVEAAGIDGQAWETLERTIDVKNVARFGLTQERFPTSCQEALLEVGGSSVRPDTLEAVRRAAQLVFTQVAPLATGVPEVLEQLAVEFRLILLTQGDFQVQERRLRDARLSPVFSGVIVTERKQIHSFRTVLHEDGRPASAAWSVGNSLPSDINPALQIGMNAIWIAAPVWEHEQRESAPFGGHLFEASDLFKARDLIFAST